MAMMIDSLSLIHHIALTLCAILHIRHFKIDVKRYQFFRSLLISLANERDENE